MHFDESPFTCQREKRNKLRFKISHFYWSFLSDIMAVKGLKDLTDSTLTLPSQNNSKRVSNWFKAHQHCGS